MIQFAGHAAAPGDLQAAPRWDAVNSRCVVDLTWMDNSDDEAGFAVSMIVDLTDST